MSETSRAAASLSIDDPMPSLSGATEWLNGPLTTEDLRGAPVLVHFWAVSCPACKSNLSKLRALTGRFGSLGLQTVAVHLPMMPDDNDVETVRATAEGIGISEPCALDHDRSIGEGFHSNGLWPHYFLFDGDGKMRGRGAGGIGLLVIKNALERLDEARGGALDSNENAENFT